MTQPQLARRALVALGAVAVALLALAPAALAAPLNDDFAAAEPLPAAGGEVSIYPFEASKEPGEPNHAGNPGGHSVWYSWTPTRSGEASIAPGCTSGANTLIGVYTGSSVGSLTEVASNEHAKPPNCFGDDDETVFTVAAGTTYWIALDGRDGSLAFHTLVLRASPANDDFAAATPIAADPPPYVAGFNRFAGSEPGEPLHAGEPGGHSLWYSWTPTASGPVEISTCSSFSPIDTLLAVYTGADLGTLTPLAANDDAPPPAGYPACLGRDSGVSIDAVAGTTYRIAVDGASGTVGNFTLRIVGRPANDGFASPVVLAGTPFGTTQGTTRLATKQTGEPDHGGDGGGASVWYSWTPDSSGPVQLVACSENPESSYEPLLGVYTGTAVDSLAAVATADESGSLVCSGAVALSFDATAGTVYRFAIDGRGGTQGRYTLDLHRPPTNDLFADASTLTAAVPSSGFGTTRMAGKESGEPGDPGDHSVWFNWTAPSSQRVLVTACAGTEFGPATRLGLYTGAAVASLTPVASTEESTDCGRRGSASSFDALAGTTYRIAVDGESGGVQGTFSLAITTRAANDDFAAATVLPADPTSASGSTVLASKQPGEPMHAGDPGGHSVWYSWTPTESGPVAITACGRNGVLDSLLAVYTGAAVNTLVEVAANDDVAGQPDGESCEWQAGTSEVEFDAVAGTTYRIAIDGKAGTAGWFGVRLDRGPGNDDFVDSWPLGGGAPGYGSATIKRASKEAGEPNHAGNPGGNSVWYSWTAPRSGSFAVSTCTYGKGLDTLLGVYTGAAVGSLSMVASDDDGASDCRVTDSEASFDAVAGTTYRIAVDGKNGSSGTTWLKIEGVAPNDSFAKPEPLASGLPNQGRGSTRFAGKQPDEPDHAGNPGGASVWFKWTAPRSGTVSIDTCASRFDTLLAVYKGAALDALTPVASNDDGSGSCAPQSRLRFDAVGNTVYKIAVDGKSGAEGVVEFHLDERAANDDLAAARSLNEGFGWYSSGSTALATKEVGEPDHGALHGGHSVWFTWTATATGPVEIDACSPSFEPLVGIYTGSELAALAPVASTPAGLGECDAGTSTRFHALGDTTYLFAVDGDEGRFDLQLREAAVIPPHMLSVQKAGAGRGSVTSSHGGIVCGPTCSWVFPAGSLVTLTASPDPGSAFAGWSGGGCSGVGTCELALGGHTSVTATFQPVAAGEGGGSGGTGGSGSAPEPPAAAPKPKPKPPLKCKPGFKKTKVKGKQKCVKKKPAKKGKGKKGRGQKR